MWQRRIEDEPNEFNPNYWYMAQIAYEVALLRHVVANMFNKKATPPEYKLQDYILKFSVPKAPEEKTPEEIEAEQEAYLANSKSAWLGAVGLTEEGKPPEKLQTRMPPNTTPPAKQTFTFGQTNGNRTPNGSVGR
jgi:hypothetical protein